LAAYLLNIGMAIISKSRYYFDVNLTLNEINKGNQI